ncbi:S-adenosylmethionine:tRNA ribosyltransferase-isomerase [Planctomycetes bacterium Pan216]|uniref:S-adenosylmethionine:tRNA ribosyltransferase-isomerase n=1 Tax=Kolteria novifilia TaxID=2527975 RepID=A0A518B9A4_9BACT|nr:S-adenosylmethionine:tRNA ribosyltransferase-isomerase [Planctomycetes bacterium Pan216]
MKVSDFDYHLPPGLIAQKPVIPRDSSRLLVFHRETGKIEHRHFRDLGDYLDPGDCLVMNDTRVVPARLLGERTSTSGRCEVFFLREEGDDWIVLTGTRGRLQLGETITIPGEPSLVIRLVERGEEKTWRAKPESEERTFTLLERYGHVPIPPYIRGGEDEPSDRETYQTIFAARAGAVAAPTAGLHFTSELVEALRDRGVQQANVTLHVGLGTFLPVKVEETSEHQMHAEWCELSSATVERLRRTREEGRRVVAVGTTSVRVLESSCQEEGTWKSFTGETRLFLTPPHEFAGVDAMITNFHLPKSTLLMLVSAFAGMESIQKVYREAVRERYRFYSYGDAMLLL